MRKQLCDALVARAAKPEMVFITGDLGFMALEPLQSVMGSRFINAGVAEQNMISVAAALARPHRWACLPASALAARAWPAGSATRLLRGIPPASCRRLSGQVVYIGDRADADHKAPGFLALAASFLQPPLLTPPPACGKGLFSSTNDNDLLSHRCATSMRRSM